MLCGNATLHRGLTNMGARMSDVYEGNEPYHNLLAVRRRRAATSLEEAVFDHDVRRTLADWATATGTMSRRPVLIGAMAVNFYIRPRFVSEIVMLAPLGFDVGLIDGFEQSAHGLVRHRNTGIALELVYSDAGLLPQSLFDQMIASCIIKDGITVASREALITWFLHKQARDRIPFESLAFVQALLEHDPAIDLSQWAIGPEFERALEECRWRAALPGDGR